LEGVFAPEVANNAVTGGALIPALALGIPGDAATAVLIGALMIKGVTPGFHLFATNMSLVYAIFITMLLANIFMASFQLFGVRLYPKILSVPQQILLPLILILSFIGAYAIAGQATSVGIYNLGIALVMGLVGYYLKRDGYPIAPLSLV
jgi:putative tricarboxylic transport membrane protein